MFLWRFARADQMVEHNFTDDVAICFAWTKTQAMKYFQFLYGDVMGNEVIRVDYRYIIKRAYVLTDY